MPLLSNYAERKKIRYFIDTIPKEKSILEIGCGSGTLMQYMKSNGWKNYSGVDLAPPADIVGDIKNWEQIGIQKESFDIIIAFEVIEHVDCIRECFDILKPGGQLLVTTPVPHMDWLCKLLEKIGFNQKRTSPHHCVYFKNIPLFVPKKIKVIGGMAQWGVFEKSMAF